MADRYWVGGSGTWNSSSTTNWSATTGGASGATVPAGGDNIFVDTGSGTPGTITISGTVTSNGINVYVTGWTIAGTANPVWNIGSLAGTGQGLHLANGTIWTNVGTVNYNGGGGNIRTNSVVISSPIIFNNQSSDWRIREQLTTTNSVTLTSGFLNMNAAIECRDFTISTGGTAATKGMRFYENSNVTVTGSNRTVFNIFGALSTFAIGGVGASIRLRVSNAASSTGTRTISTGGTYLWNYNIVSGSDNVFIDERIGVGSAGGRSQDLNFDSFTGTFRIGNPTFTFSIFGNLRLSTGMTFASTSNTITMAAASSTAYIAGNNTTINAPLIFNGAGGAWILENNLQLGASNTVSLLSGTLNLNNTTLKTGRFTTSGSSSRSVNFQRSGEIELNDNNAQILNWDIFSGYASLNNVRIKSTYTGSAGTRWFRLNAAELSSPNVGLGSVSNISTSRGNIQIIGGTDNITISGTAWDVNLKNFTGNFGVGPGLTVYSNVDISTINSTNGAVSSNAINPLAFAGTQTFTRQLVSNAKIFNFPVQIITTSGGVLLRDNLIFNANILSSPSIDVRGPLRHTSGNLNLNNVIVSTPRYTSNEGASALLIFNTSDQIQLTGSNAEVWDTRSGTLWSYQGIANIKATSTTPIQQQRYVFGPIREQFALNVSGASNINSINIGEITAGRVNLNGNIKSLDLTGFTGQYQNNTAIIHGNLTIPVGSNLQGGTQTVIINVTTTTSNINTNDITLPFPVTLGVATGGTYRLISNLRTGITNVVTYNSGNLNLNNNFLITNSFVSTSSIARVLQFGTTGGISVFGGNTTIINLSGTAPNSIGVQGNFNMVSTYLGSVGTRTITTSTGSDFQTAINVDVGSGTGNSIVILGGTDNLNINGTGVRDLLLDGFTGTLLNATRTIYGNLTVDAAGILQGGTGITTFAGTGPRQTITSNGKRFDFRLTFNGIGGQFSLGDNLTVNSANTTTLTAGTFSLNSYVLSTGVYAISGSLARSINFGNSKIICTNNGAPGGGTVFQLASSTNWSRTGVPNIDITGFGAANRLDISCPSVAEDAAFDFNVTSASGTVNFPAAGQVGNVYLNTPGSVQMSGLTFYGSYKIAQLGNLVQFPATNLTFSGSANRLQEIDTRGILHNYGFLFNGTGTYKLLSNLLQASDRTLTFTTGNLWLNGYTYTVGLLAATGTGTRVLTCSNGNLVLSSSSVATVWDMNGTNFTRVGVANVEISGPGIQAGGDTPRTISWGTGATEDNSIDWKIIVPSGRVSFGAGSAAGNLYINTPGEVTLAGTTIYGDYSVINTSVITSSTSNLRFGGSSARIQRINANGFLHDQPLVFTGQGTYILTSALRTTPQRSTVFTSGNLDLNDNVLTTGVFLSNAATVRTLIFDNTGRINLTAINNTTVFSTSPSTGLQVQGNAAVYVTNNIPAGNIITITPGSVLEANTVGFWISGGAANSRVAFTTNASIRDLNFSGSASTLINANLLIYGNITLGTSGTFQGGPNTWVFASTAGQETIETDGKLITWPLRFDGVGGNWKLVDDLTISNSNVLTLNSGNLDAGVFNVNVGTFNSFVANTRTLSIGTGNWTIYNNDTSFNVQNVNSFTVVGSGNIRMAGNNPKTFNGGGANTYPTLTNIGAGNLTIAGNNNIITLSNEVMGTYWIFTHNTNTTITNWNINGTELNPVRIQSNQDNFVHFIRKASGNITGTYLVIKDSNVGSYGGGTWYALYSTDSGNNTGWTFSSNNANFLVMFF